MSRFIPDPEALRLGEALAALRRERGLSQAEAGARLDMTSQGWGLYEAGRRSGLFRPDVQRRLTGALDSTPEALALALPPMTAPSTDNRPAIAPAAQAVESRGRRSLSDSPPASPERRPVPLGGFGRGAGICARRLAPARPGLRDRGRRRNPHPHL